MQAGESRDEQIGSDLQPAVSAVSEQDLTEFGSTREAEHLRRLEADTQLMFRLSVEGFDGNVWGQVSRALVEYGYTVIRSWVRTDQICGRCRAKNIGVPDMSTATGGPPRPHEIEELVQDTVADAIVNFRDEVLGKGLWNPAKGASLTTYFVGNCLLRFPNRVRAWMRLRDRVRLVEPSEALPSVVQAQQPGSSDPVASEVVGSDTSRRMVTRILEPVRDETNRAILLLRGEGFGIDEIAEVLGLGHSQVESRIYRARKKLRRGGHQ